MRKDVGHEMTDKLLSKLEKELLNVYNECYNKTKKKLNSVKSVLAKYDKELTKNERIKLWKEKKRLEALLNSLVEDIQEVNKLAESIINNELLNVYEINSNYANYLLEIESGYQLNFKLYNQEIIKQLLLDEENNFTKIALNNLKDKKRIYKELKNSFMQSIRLGESIEQIAKRVRKIVNKNMNDSIRIARTETTRMESIGRQEMFKKGEDMGLKLKKVWISTADSRTRESHLLLNRKSVGLDERFSNGLRYPGDYTGRASEVCNCRCSHVVEIEGVKKSSNLQKLEKEVQNATYQEWLRRKSKKK